MKNIKYSFFLLLFLLQFSCVKDDTNYVLKEIDEITIEDFAKIYEVEIGSNLKITPVVKTKFGNESGLTYMWYKYQDRQELPDTLSYEKVLDVEINDVQPGVETIIMLKVTDSKTGIFTRKGSKFIIKGVYSDGTMILTRTGNDYDLSFLKSKTDVLRENLYSGANDGEKLGVKSKKILLPNPDKRYSPVLKAVIITCDDPTGGVYLNPDFLNRTGYMRDKLFFGDDFPGNINITSYAVDAVSDYLIIDGKLHPRPVIMQGGGGPTNGQWLQPMIVRAEPSDYYLSDAFAQPHDGSALFGNPFVYDNLHKRFFISTLYYGYFSFLSTSVITGGQFDPNNMGEGLEMVMTGYSNGSVNDIWALMKNTITDEYVMISYMFVIDKVTSTYKFMTKSKTVLSRENYPNLYNGTLLTPGTYVFAAADQALKLRGVSDFFFFLNNNKVYAFNTSSLAEVAIIDGANYNYTITGIKCEEMPEPTDPDVSFVRLGISVKDNALSTKSAGLVFFKLSSLGGLSVDEYYSRMGICDEIIDFKEQLD